MQQQPWSDWPMKTGNMFTNVFSWHVSDSQVLIHTHVTRQNVLTTDRMSVAGCQMSM